MELEPNVDDLHISGNGCAVRGRSVRGPVALARRSDDSKANEKPDALAFELREPHWVSDR